MMVIRWISVSNRSKHYEHFREGEQTMTSKQENEISKRKREFLASTCRSKRENVEHNVKIDDRSYERV